MSGATQAGCSHAAEMLEASSRFGGAGAASWAFDTAAQAHCNTQVQSTVGCSVNWQRALSRHLG